MWCSVFCSVFILAGRKKAYCHLHGLISETTSVTKYQLICHSFSFYTLQLLTHKWGRNWLLSFRVRLFHLPCWSPVVSIWLHVSEVHSFFMTELETTLSFLIFVLFYLSFSRSILCYFVICLNSQLKSQLCPKLMWVAKNCLKINLKSRVI